MAAKQYDKIYKICPQCKGTGILIRKNYSENSTPETTEGPCPNCNGEKMILWGKVERPS